MSYWPGFHLGLHKIFLQGPVRGFHKDLCKIFLQGPLQDLGTRLFCRSENSHKDLYKIMQGPLGGFHLQLDLDKIFLQPPDFLEHNVHTCPQDIFLYLITWLAFHYWYASNCSSSFLDARVKSRSRCQTAGGRLHDSDCRDPVGSLTNKCAVMSTAAMSVDVKSKESSVSADRILKANADLQQLMPSGSFKIFDCTLKTASCYT